MVSLTVSVTRKLRIVRKWGWVMKSNLPSVPFPPARLNQQRCYTHTSAGNNTKACREHFTFKLEFLPIPNPMKHFPSIDGHRKKGGKIIWHRVMRALQGCRFILRYPGATSLRTQYLN